MKNEKAQSEGFFIPPADQNEAVRSEIVSRIQDKFSDLLDEEDRKLLAEGTLGLEALSKKYRQKFLEKVKSSKIGA